MKQLMLVGSGRGRVANICVVEPVQCGCGRMVCFLVNREGTTRCLDCDEKAQALPCGVDIDALGRGTRLCALPAGHLGGHKGAP